MDKYQEILQQVWGYPDFRGIQRDIIESIAGGKDTLGLMPTGGGKSITFQVPALAQEGVCIVITPLIALMKDQVVHLKERGIRAESIYSGKTRSEIIQILENCIFGGIKILYVSPERLGTEIFQVKLRHIKVSFICVDEAHCISQWGYDFRPSYLHIADIRKMKPEAPILALTATATPDVVTDIQKQLQFKEENVFQMSFERKNLAYVVRQTKDKHQEAIHILNSVAGSAIVYVRNRKRTKEIAELLKQEGISATFYHAGLDFAVRDERQKAWQEDKVRVIVATNAFGMGIDKADVRVVIHIDWPDSLEAYFQEAGRAGRDGQKSYAVLLYEIGVDENKLGKRMAENFPEKEYIRKVYDSLAYFFQVGVASGMGKTFTFHIDKFCQIYKYFPIHVNSALRILERCGYIDYEADPDNRARVMFLLERHELYMLENLSAKEETVITALLRLYGGLFVDFVYIDESLVSIKTELTEQQIYMVLKNLSDRHILKFIPRQKIPYITYTRQREDGNRIIIPKEVWEDRREQYKKRIEAMTAYAQNDSICRSRQLLRYFGETRSEDCHQCDVCLNHPNMVSDATVNRVTNSILSLLEDGKEHHLRELHALPDSKENILQSLNRLIAENVISTNGSFIRLTDK